MKASQRIITHFDLDSFFVSVEILNDLSLKDKPVIVGGRERGVVAACSYAARKFGIHSAMPSKKAMQLCPQAIFLKGNRAEYSKYSRWVTQIIASKAPLFEKASIDEFYIDLTGMEKFFNPLQWTIDLRQQIINETQLPISFGLSSNKMMAKIATNEAKPNGYLQIPFGKEQEFLALMPVNKIPGVGDHTHAVLKEMGIEVIKDISDRAKEELEEHLGKWGIDLWYKSQGLYHGEVSAYHESKSISNENTFNENINDKELLMAELIKMVERTAYELRKEGKVAGCITVKIRYPDFETTTKQTSVTYTSSDDEIISVAKDLFNKLHKKEQSIRLLGVRLSELTNNPTQTSLFSNTQKKVNLYKAIDAVKERFGKNSLARASSKK